MDGLEDFFAQPRKAKKKTDLSKTKVTPTRQEPSLIQKSTELEKDLIEETENHLPLKERYKATPKKVVVRKFDEFMDKRIQINEDDLLYITTLEKQIAFERKKSSQDFRGENRITSNTIIRLLIQEFVKKASTSEPKSLLTEDSIKTWIKSL